MADHKEEEFKVKVIDRRPFTAEGEIRKEIVEEQEREAKREEVIAEAKAAVVLGAYADPNTGQPMLDPDAARELIDMLDALQQKTKGNLAPEENDMLVDLLGKLKLTYLEISNAMAAEMAKVTAQAKGGKK